MCGGQHADLTHPEPTLEEYWQQAAAKSGAFFALACRCGARLASADPAMLRAYDQLGQHLGLLVQIKDDLDDVRPGGKGGYGQRAQLGHSLPYLYALQVLPAKEQARLRRYMGEARRSARAARQALELIDRAGAATYMRLELERHSRMARQALESAHPLPPAVGMLEEYIQTLS